MPGAPFKPSFGLSGIMALDAPLLDCHALLVEIKSPQKRAGFSDPWRILGS
jgi:hypothetical protein